MNRIIAILLLTACEPLEEGFEGPTDQWEGWVQEENSEEEPGLTGTIDTGFWEEEEEPLQEDQQGPPDCSPSDLLFVAEIHDLESRPQEVFLPGDDLHFVGRTVNPCTGRVTLTTTSTCLVFRWEIANSEGTTIGIKPDCTDGDTRWELEPGDQLLQTSTSRSLPEGDYTLTVRFNAEPFMARQAFAIE